MAASSHVVAMHWCLGMWQGSDTRVRCDFCTNQYHILAMMREQCSARVFVLFKGEIEHDLCV